MLLTLPNEILSAICEGCDIQTLKCLRLLNSRISKIAAPATFRHASRRFESADGNDFMAMAHGPVPPAFADSLFIHIENLQMDERDINRLYSTVPPDSDAQAFYGRLRSFELSFRYVLPDGVQQLQSFSSLVAMMRNLQILTLRAPFKPLPYMWHSKAYHERAHDTAFLKAVNRIRPDERQPFSALQKLVLAGLRVHVDDLERLLRRQRTTLQIVELDNVACTFETARDCPNMFHCMAYELHLHALIFRQCWWVSFRGRARFKFILQFPAQIAQIPASSGTCFPGWKISEENVIEWRRKDSTEPQTD